MGKEAEPPSTESTSTAGPFLIGRNGHGNWVVRDRAGRRGGLFVDRTEALRFALFENGRRPQAVLMVPEILELDLGQPSVNPLPEPATPRRKAA